MGSPSPANAKALHNFGLPELRWYHRREPSTEESPPPNPAIRHSPVPDFVPRKSLKIILPIKPKSVSSNAGFSENRKIDNAGSSENRKISVPESAKHTSAVSGCKIKKSEKNSIVLNVDNLSNCMIKKLDKNSTVSNVSDCMIKKWEKNSKNSTVSNVDDKKKRENNSTVSNVECVSDCMIKKGEKNSAVSNEKKSEKSPTVSNVLNCIIKEGEKISTVSNADASGTNDALPRTYIRLRWKSKNPGEDPAEGKSEGKKPVEVPGEGKTGKNNERKAVTAEGEEDELVQKSWNLRPRKPFRKPRNVYPGTWKIDGAALQDDKAPLPTVADGGGEAKAAEKKKKKPKPKPKPTTPMAKFSLSLSRQEIEEDIFSLTGSKPSRRPKKRSKAVQKIVDNLTPGGWLSSVSLDAYKVPEAHPKG